MGSRAHIPPTLDDDDDDFQDPIPTFSLSQRPPLHPRSPTSKKPLKSCVAAPPRKKLKLPPARGKENSPILQGKVRGSSRQGNEAGRERPDAPPRSESAEVLPERNGKVNAREAEGSNHREPLLGLAELHERHATPRQMVSLLQIESHCFVDEFKIEKDSVPKHSGFHLDPEKSTPDVFRAVDGNNAMDLPTCTETKQGKSSDVCSSTAASLSTRCHDYQGPEYEGTNTLKHQYPPVAKPDSSPSCSGVSKLTCLDGGSYSRSIESRLLQSRATCFSSITDSCPDNNEEGDFEAGTQLKELMNLCSMVDDSERLSVIDGYGSGEAVLFTVGKDSDFEGSAHERTASVECPLCGMDITNFNEELRYVHTNECLDKDIFPKVNILSDGSDQQMIPNNDASRVCQFLASLGLSRYEDLFLKEEVDWDTLQWLTEEDLLGMGISVLGPRKKIVRALCQLRQGNSLVSKQPEIAPREVSGENVSIPPGNKLITEFFQSPSCSRYNVNVRGSVLAVAERGNNNVAVGTRKAARNRGHTSRLRDIPSWCSIPGTQFRVDAFRFLRADCSHWFLTHFHMDHYQGLTKNFRHGKIYCSAVTANLVNTKIGISWDRLHILPMGQKIQIDGISVTCLDANHCPGSIMILFEPPNGEVVLHTGDFRFCEAMANSSILQLSRIHTLILDTTYCNPLYDFPTQESVIQFVIDAIQAEAFNPRTLFLIGSYTVGKERLFLEVARFLKKKMYVGAAKLRLLQCLGLPQEDMQWFTLNEMESQVHVVPMWTIASFKRMKHLTGKYSAQYNLIVAFAPTGWTFGKGKKKSAGRRWQQGTIIRYEVPYSEHSSFSELREFVQFVSPEVVIPSVNNNGPESAESMVALLRSSSPGSTAD